MSTKGKITRKEPNGYIITTPRSEGKYSTIHNRILFDENLSSDAKVLMIMLINHPKGTKISLNYYRKKIGCGSEKFSKLTKMLVENGYLKGIQYPQGNENGYKYHYTVSEFGDLKPNKDDDGNIVVFKGAVRPYSKTEHHKSKDIPVEVVPDVVEVLPMEDVVEYLMSNVPDEVIAANAHVYDEIYNKQIPYAQKIKEIDSFNNQLKKDCYKYFMDEVNSKLVVASPTVTKIFTKWLKFEIFDNFNLNINPSRKLLHLKQQNPTVKKIPLEDKLYELSEQPND